MYFLLNMGIFQPAMLDYQGVTQKSSKAGGVPFFGGPKILAFFVLQKSAVCSDWFLFGPGGSKKKMIGT